MRNFCDRLFNNGTFVEILGYVVAGGADDFYASFEGAVVGFGACKCREEGVVNVDDFVFEVCHKFGA